jgi:hypothetical protein
MPPRNRPPEAPEDENTPDAPDAPDAPNAEGTPDASGTGQPDANGSAPASTNPVLMVIPLDELGEAEDVPETEYVLAPLRTPVVRSEGQKVIDKEVKDIYDKWIAAGKPVEAKSPRKRRLANPQHAPAIRHMINQAAILHDIKVVISPPSHDQNGKEVIVFSTRDKPVERTNRADEAAANAAMREWAKRNGWPTLTGRGRVPVEAQAKYKSAMEAEAKEAAARNAEAEKADA